MTDLITDQNLDDLNKKDLQDETFEPEIQEPETCDDELTKAQARIKELEVELATERANIFNERQRLRKESQETRQRTQDEVVTLLLPVLDVLDMALRTPVSNSESDAAARNILKGVEMTRMQFLNVLNNELGVSLITAPRGTAFDPKIHYASVMVPVDDPELDGKVIDEQLKGYQTAKNRVLRAAQVTVGKFTQA